MSYSYVYALTELQGPTNYSVSGLMDLVRGVSGEVLGATGNSLYLLYSGVMSDGMAAGDVVGEIAARSTSEVYDIGSSEVGKLLNSSAFHRKLRNAVSMDMFGTLTPNADQLIEVENKVSYLLVGKNASGERVFFESFWDVASFKFVEEAKGNFKLVSSGYIDQSSVFAKSELPAALALHGKTINGLSLASLDEMKVAGTMDDVLGTIGVRSLQESFFSRLSASNFDEFLSMTDDDLSVLMKDSQRMEEFRALAGRLDALNPGTGSYLQTVNKASALANELPSGGGKLAAAIGLLSILFSAAAAGAEPDPQRQKQIVVESVLNVLGGEAAAIILPALTVAALGAAGVASAPVVGALTLASALLGGFLGGDAVVDLYRLTDDLDYNGRMDLIDRISNILFGDYTLTSLPLPEIVNGGFRLDASFGRDQVVSEAKNDIAWRFALRDLNPFVITGADYSRFNTDGSLDLFDPETGKGSMTEKYLQDRAAMLTWKIRYDTGQFDEDDVKPGEGRFTARKAYNEDWDTSTIEGNWDFVDLTRGLDGHQALTITIDGSGLSLADHQIVFGSSSGELLEGGGDTDSLYGMGGDDTLRAGDKADYLEGNAGNDKLYGEAGNDVLVGGSGNDTLEGGADKDRLYGELGDDKLVGGEGADYLVGGNGADTLEGGKDKDVIEGGKGDDILVGGDAGDLLRGGEGFDRYEVKGGEIIEDSDFQGSIVFEGTTLYMGNWVPEGRFWADDENKVRYKWVNTGAASVLQISLIADPSKVVTIQNFTNGLFGITLDEPPAPQVPSGYIVNGDLKPEDPDGDGPLTYRLDDRSNVVTTVEPLIGMDDVLRADPVVDSVINGGAGNDALLGFSGKDVLKGGIGDDLMLGGGGEDSLYGGAGNDVLISSLSYDFQYVPDDRARPYWLINSVQSDASSVIWGRSWVSYRFEWGTPDHNQWITTPATAVDSQEKVGNYLNGEEGEDTISGGAGIDEIYGGSGNDWILGGGDHDQIFGEDGDDEIDGDRKTYLKASAEDLADDAIGRHGNDIIDGGNGNDLIRGDGGSDLVYGGGDQDTIYGDFQEDTEDSYGAHGLDTLDGGAGNDVMAGGGENDRLYGGTGDDYIFGDMEYEKDLPETLQGHDLLDGGAGADGLIGGLGDDSLSGGDGQDTLWGDYMSSSKNSDKGGDDELYGGKGADGLIGGNGKDRLYGGEDNDTIYGDMDGASTRDSVGGDDFIYGEDGADQVFAGGGDDTLFGGDGKDTLEGNKGDDLIDGGDKEDGLLGWEGDDTLYGGAGNDTLCGDQGDASANATHDGDGNDLIYAGDGNDTIRAGGGDDSLYGEAGVDTLMGGAGNDYLDDGGGTGYMIGGAGDDTLAALESGGKLVAGEAGDDTYLMGISDRIEFHDTLGRNRIVLSGGASAGLADLKYEEAQTPEGQVVGLLTGAGVNIVLANAQGSALESVQLADGTVVTFAALLADYCERNGTSIANGDKWIDGAGGGVASVGAAYTTVAAGQGDDQLELAGGGKLVAYRAGDGTDGFSRAAQGSSGNTLHFGPGITLDSLDVSFSGNVLSIRTGAAGDEIQIKDVLTNSQTGEWISSVMFSSFRFADGSSYTIEQLLARTGIDVLGSATGDKLSGVAGADTLSGLAGDDSLAGGLGSDTYVVRRGEGADWITETGSDAGATDTLIFAAGINPADVKFGRIDNDLFVVLKGSDTDRVGVVGGALAGNGTIERFVFADGSVLDISAALAAAVDLNQVLNGTDGDDTLEGDFGKDTIDGGAGNDLILGRGGNDYLKGGEGNDSIDGGGGVNVANGGAGDDTLTGNNDYGAQLIGGAGNDLIYGGSVGYVFGDDGNSVDATTGWNSAWDGAGVGSGNDTIIGGRYVYAGDGDNLVQNADYIITGSGRDTVSTGWDSGESYPIYVKSGDGNDSIDIGPGGYTGVYSGSGNDTISIVNTEGMYVYAEEGDDLLRLQGTAKSAYLGLQLGNGDDQAFLDGTFGHITFNGGNSGKARLEFGSILPTVLADGFFGQVTSAMPVEFIAKIDYGYIQMTLGAGNDFVSIDRELQSYSNYYRSNDGIQTGFGDDTVVANGIGYNSYFELGSGNDSVEVGAVVGYDFGFSGRDQYLWVNGDAGNDLIRVNSTSLPVYEKDFSGYEMHLVGGEGVDTIYGSDVGEVLYASTYENVDDGVVDHLYGGDGDDTLYGSLGDVMDGGGGNNTFIFSRNGAGATAGDRTVFRPESNQTTTLDFSALTRSTDSSVFSLLSSKVGIDISGGGRTNVSGTSLSHYIGPGIATGGVLFYVEGGWEIFDDGFSNGLGSFAVNFSNGASIHFEDFDRNDVLKTRPFEALVFEDGTEFSYDQLIARGFDIYAEGKPVIDPKTGVVTPEVVEGTNVVDRFHGSAGDQILSGGAGSDTYFYALGDGDDKIRETANSANGDVDKVRFGSGIDFSAVRASRSGGDLVLRFGSSGETLTVADWIVGGSSRIERFEFANGAGWREKEILKLLDGVIVGTDGSDLVAGSVGHDHVEGSDGDDTIIGGSGNDTLDGGAGIDTLSYASAASGVMVSLAYAGTNAGSDGADLQYNFENLSGSAYNDGLFGDDIGTANMISGGLGSDTIMSWAGNDTLYGGEGVDVLYGGADQDILYGEAGNDQLYGGKGNDTLDAGDNDDWLEGNLGDDNLLGGAGADTLNGGAGSNALNGGDGLDTASYQDAAAGVTVSLAVSTAQATGGAGIDSLSNLENLSGSAYNDSLTGDASANSITANAGNDSLYGGAGNDSLLGGAGSDLVYGGQGDDQLWGGKDNDMLAGGFGNDTLTGGLGADTFLFSTALNASTNLDLIADFNSAESDLISLSASIFTAFSGQIGSTVGLSANLSYNAGTGALSYDADGAGAGSAVQFATLGSSTHPGSLGTVFAIVA